MPDNKPEDPRAAMARENGKLGGRTPDKKPFDTAALVESTANAILSGKRAPSFAGGPEPRPLNDKDREYIARIAGMPAEEFQKAVCSRMQELGMMTADRIYQKLEADTFKPETLPFLLSVLVDKVTRIQGRNSIAQPFTQINVFGDGMTRDALLRSLTPSAQQIDVTPALGVHPTDELGCSP